MGVENISMKEILPHFEKQNGCPSRLLENALEFKILQLTSSDFHNMYISNRGHHIKKGLKSPLSLVLKIENVKAMQIFLQVSNLAPLYGRRGS